MEVRLSALCAGRPLPPGRFWYSFLLEAESTTGAIVRLEGLRKLKKSTSSGLEPTTFRLVAQCLNHLRYKKGKIKSLNIYNGVDL
jgi:hypothetical protein